MYKELFEKNKEAIVFLQKEENLSDSEVNSITPIRHTKLNVKTIVGIADLMTRFAESKANGVSAENKALHIDGVMPRISHFEDRLGNIHPREDALCTLNNENGVVVFYADKYHPGEKTRMLLKPIYEA